MTVVNPKSISGITSITTASGSDNLLTIHTSDASNTERFRIDSTGTTKIVTGIVTTLTATTGIVTTLTTNTAKVGTGITITSGGINVTGVTTSTTFVGALTGTASGNPTLANGVNNRVITASSSTALTGESALTFDGNTLTVSAPSNDTPFIVDTASTNGAHLRFQKDGSNQHFIGAGGGISLGDAEDLSLRAYDNILFATGNSSTQRLKINSNGEFIMADSSTKTFIDLETTGNNTRAVMSLKGKTSGGGDVQLLLGGYGDTQRGEVFTYTNHDLGFATNNASTQFKCKTNGNFEIVNGDLKVASGHGIDFSATSDGPSMGNELFDDYEEGSYIPVISASGTTYTYGSGANYTLRSPHANADNNSISYVKIGSMVYLNFTIFWNSTLTIRYAMTIPFTAKGSAYALCITPASFQVDIDGDMLGTLGLGNNSTGFDTYRILKDTGTGGHGNVPLSGSSEVYYQICYQAL